MITMIRFTCLTLALISLIASCKQETSSTSKEEIQTEQVAAEDDSGKVIAYPSLPSDTFKSLLERCDYVDVIFNDVDVSMNQSNNSDIKAMLSTIVYGDIELPVCSESAYMNFQSQGEIIAEGNLYLRGKCRYIIWLEDGKPKYGNKFNDSGMNLFNKVLSAGTPTTTQ